MDSLAQIVKETVFWYVSSGFDHKMYGVMDETKQLYAVLGVDFPIHKRQPDIIVMARIADDRVIVEEDRTDRPLVEELVRKGVPREKIFHVQDGKLLPDAEIIHDEQVIS